MSKTKELPFPVLKAPGTTTNERGTVRLGDCAVTFNVSRPYPKRRYFTTHEVARLRALAAAGKSQNLAAWHLERDPGVIAQAALRYGIEFHARPGRPRTTEPEVRRRQRAEAVRRWRQRQKLGVGSDD